MYSRVYPLSVLRRPSFLFLVLIFLVTLHCYKQFTNNQNYFATPWARHISREASDVSRETPSPNTYSLNFSQGVPKLPGSNYSRALVIPRLQREDVSWIAAELKDVEEFVYVVDDPSAPLHPPLNKGHEAMVYLTYLIDHYDNFPDIMIFMHSHGISWHNEEALAFKAAELINRLSNERVTRDGYMNLRCNWGPGCPDWLHPRKKEADPGKQEEVILAKSWTELFPTVEVPEVLSQACCAQFALSGERARAIPKSKYIFYRDWILRTELSDYISGRVWEYLWQVVFTGQNVFCPEQHVCYCDGYGLCFGGAKGMDEHFGLIYQKRDQVRALDKWRKMAKAIEDAEKEGKPPEEIEKMERPEPGKDKVMEGEIEEKKQRLDKMVEIAKEKGKDPRIRAEEAGRPWKEGDGF